MMAIGKAPVSPTVAITIPLHLIFWGGILYAVDINFITRVGDGGLRFDMLDDFAGMVMITIGTRRLARFAVSPAWLESMRFITFCCVLNCFRALFEHIIFPAPLEYLIFWSLANLLSLAAIVKFCTCMAELALARRMRNSSRSWLTTRRLFLYFWVIPAGLAQIVGLLCLVIGRNMHLELATGPAFLLAQILLLLIPLVHLFLSASRIRAEAELLLV